MSYFIYIISFLEWFTTLSVEIIAIRNFTPIVWTNSISTSIILWVILLALSYWYYIWGKNSKLKEKNLIKNKVTFNLFVSWVYYLFFTFLFDSYILNLFLELTWSYFISILVSSFFLFFIPVFLASQTIPLLSEVLKWDNTWEKIWKLLFFSTIWSFLWAVLTSSLLFPLIWVFKSWVVDSFILLFISFILWLQTYKKFNLKIIVIFVFLLISISFLFIDIFANQKIIFQKANSYHNIIVYDNSNNQRIFSLNNAYSSWIDVDSKQSFFKYIKEIKSLIINEKDENILVIWAAWFTLPNELSEYDFIKNIDVVDVDNSLKKISEDYFFEKKLSSKINFYAEPSRFFINKSIKSNKKYDAIVVDVYVWKSMPSQTLTKEFFDDLNTLWGKIYLNIITDSILQSDFSIKLFNTISNSFWALYYKDVNNYNSLNAKTNFVITNKYILWYKEYNYNKDYPIYTDDKNSIEIDLFNNNHY